MELIEGVIMKECECLSNCPFFAGRVGIMLPTIVETLKSKYCHSDSNECARYQIFCKLGRDFVPADLLPDQMEIALLYLEKFDLAKASVNANAQI